MNIFRRIFDFIIPLMPSEPRDEEETNNIKAEEIQGSDAVLSRKAAVSQQYYNDERSRTRTIEGKASMFITSSGFLGTVLIGTANIIVSQTGNTAWLRVLMILCLLFFAIYMVGTIFYALKALKRGQYSRPDPVTILNMEGEDFDKNAIADLVNSTAYNQRATNLKMDYVVVAQRYYRRLMFSVLAFVVVLLFYVLHQSGVSLLKWLSDVNTEVSTWSFNTWYVLLSSLLLVVVLIMSIVALVKIHEIKADN
jgi:hypothetical protein